MKGKRKGGGDGCTPEKGLTWGSKNQERPRRPQGSTRQACREGWPGGVGVTEETEGGWGTKIGGGGVESTEASRVGAR